jgi:hypothetical protein
MRNNNPVTFEHAYQRPSGNRWIMVNTGSHWGGEYWEAAQIEAGERVTFWQYSRTGLSMGQSGTLKPDAPVRHVTRAKDREAVEHKERCLRKSVEMSQVFYDMAKEADSVLTLGLGRTPATS